MKINKTIACTLFIASICGMLLSCADNMDLLKQTGLNQLIEQGTWKELAAAADSQTKKTGKVELQFDWETKRSGIFMLASLNEESAVLYKITQNKSKENDNKDVQINCYFDEKKLFCTEIGETGPVLVMNSDVDFWSTLESHAVQQLEKMKDKSKLSINSQIKETNLTDNIDISKNRHFFEWGGEYETIENALAFLQTLNKKRFLSVTSQKPNPPEVFKNTSSSGIPNNYWQNSSLDIYFKTNSQCESTLANPERVAYHWADGGRKILARYDWQQRLDWGKIIEIKEKDTKSSSYKTLYLKGIYNKNFEALKFISQEGNLKMSPELLYSKYPYDMKNWIAEFNLEPSMLERTIYAVTFLNIMCGKQHNKL